MRKFFVIFVLFTTAAFSFAQKTITMEKDGGVYKIPCTVNGAKMKMVFDTGASTVSLSMSIANYLYENEYITKDDIVGKGQSYVASGDIVDHIVIILRDIEIAGMHLRNIEATVIDGQNAPLLLGQTAIQALGSLTINGNLLIINEAPNSELSSFEVEKLRKEYKSFMGVGSYFAAMDHLLKLKESNNFTISECSDLSICFFECEQYENCIENYRQMLLRPESKDPANEFYVAMAQMYTGDCYYNLGEYGKAISWYEKTGTHKSDAFPFKYVRTTFTNLAMAYGKIGNKEKCNETFNFLVMFDNEGYDPKESSKEAAKKFKGVDFIQRMADDFAAIGEACIQELLDVKPSVPLSMALRLQCYYLGYDYSKVVSGNIKGFNLKLGHILYRRGLYADDVEEADKYIRLAESWGDKDANKFMMKIRAKGWD